MNRLLTSLVQLFLVATVVYCFRLMLPELKQDAKEFFKLIKK